MKKFFLTLALLLFYSPAPVFADPCNPPPRSQEQIDSCQKFVDALSSQANTLAGQITYYDAQIKLVLSKITQTENQITSISSKIELLEQKLQDRSKLLERQIVQTYKKGGLDPLQIFISSEDFSQILSRVKYLQIIQANNRKFLYDTQTVQASYAQQKELIEESRKRLQAQKTYLANLRTDRQNLLNETKKSEAIYQQLLATARAELAASSGQGEERFVRDIRGGEIIGRVISSASGCSSGQHLHFEIHKDNQVVDPNNYLKPIAFSYAYTDTSYYGLINPHGNWEWPMNDPIKINQGFGTTGYARNFYSGGIHNGVDIDSPSDSVVKAVKPGKLYLGSIRCGGRYPGALLYAKVEQSDGIIALYLHIIPQ